MKNKDPWYNTQQNPEGILNYLSLALLGACNGRCVFCYVDGDRPGIWKPEELTPILEDASNLGMKKIQLSGGEPLLYPQLDQLLALLNEMEIEILLATNATLITPEIAASLAEHKVKVGVSIESIDAAVSDELSGVPGFHAKKLEGIERLRLAGYTFSDDLPLNIIIKTLKQNLPSFLDTWQWAKDQGIQPILDRAIPGQRCKLEWVVEPHELRYLLDGIGAIEGVYHRIPFLNNEGCNRIGNSAHIEVDGSVLPCAGIQVSMGNVRVQPLREIWRNSELAKQLREYKTRLTGSCKTCEESSICCGCRAVAYATMGDIFGPDTLCWGYKREK